MNKPILTTVLTFASLMLPLSAEASSFTGLNIFGDSLVETGNLFNVTSRSSLTPALPPSPPYFQGRFSNKKIWIDILAENFNLNPVLFSDLGTTLPTQGVNFGFSSATTGFSNTASDFLPGLQQQINSFSDLTAIAPADANALYVIWAGSNDYLQALSSPESLTVSPEELPEQATDNLLGAVESLYDLGARHFLIANLSNIGDSPFGNSLDGDFPGSSDLLNAFTSAHNLFLETKLNNLDASLSGIDLRILDVNSLFRDIATKPSQLGFSDTNNSCLVNFKPLFEFEGICDNPDEFAFWDDIHPTGAVNELVAQLALDTLEQKERVPEPNNIGSLLVFVGLTLSWVHGCKYRVNK